MSAAQPVDEAREPQRGFRLLFALALAAGAAIRLDQLGAQVLADDEWHALRALHFHGYRWIFTNLGVSDHSIPLTLAYRALADTVGLSEWGMRLPVVVAGIAVVAAGPLLARRFVGAPTAVAFAWLLAIAPVLVYFSRYARPYSIALLCAVVAPLAARRFWASGGRGAWLGLLAAGVLGPWFHLTVLPAVLAPLGVLGILALAKRGPPRGRALLVLAACVALGLAALLGPPLLSNPEGLGGKSGRGAVSAETWLPALRLFGGTAQLAALVALGIAALVGAVLLARRDALTAALVGASVVAQAAGLAVANPYALEYPMPLVRYALPILPWVLLAVACTLGRLDRIAARRGTPAGVVTLVAVGALVTVGPLPSIHFRPNAFTNHNLYQHQYDDEARASYGDYLRRGKPWPEFYAELEALPPGSVTIVEAPWYYPWIRVFFNLAQERHRQHVLIGFVGRPAEPIAGDELPLEDPRYAFRNFVDVRDVDGLIARGVDFVVLHRRLKGEMRTSQDLARIQPARTRIDEYRARFGAPHFEDADVVVFDLTAARRDPGAPSDAPELESEAR